MGTLSREYRSALTVIPLHFAPNVRPTSEQIKTKSCQKQALSITGHTPVARRAASQSLGYVQGFTGVPLDTPKAPFVHPCGIMLVPFRPRLGIILVPCGRPFLHQIILG